MTANELFTYYKFQVIQDTDNSLIYTKEGEKEKINFVFDKQAKSVEVFRSVLKPSEGLEVGKCYSYEPLNANWKHEVFPIGRKELVMITRQFEEFGW